jgi:hypothetical protein
MQDRFGSHALVQQRLHDPGAAAHRNTGGALPYERDGLMRDLHGGAIELPVEPGRRAQHRLPGLGIDELGRRHAPGGGFQTWRSLGRSVTKGEKGIAILAPVTYKTKPTAETAPRPGRAARREAGRDPCTASARVQGRVRLRHRADPRRAAALRDPVRARGRRATAGQATARQRRAHPSHQPPRMAPSSSAAPTFAAPGSPRCRDPASRYHRRAPGKGRYASHGDRLRPRASTTAVPPACGRPTNGPPRTHNPEVPPRPRPESRSRTSCATAACWIPPADRRRGHDS